MDMYKKLRDIYENKQQYISFSFKFSRTNMTLPQKLKRFHFIYSVV